MRYILAFLSGCAVTVGILLWLADRDGLTGPAYRRVVSERARRC